MRKLLVGLVGPVFLIIAAAVAIPLVIPVTAYEGRLITLVKRATGRDLKIAGPAKLSLFPALELEASDVSLTNPPDARSPDMVKLKQLQMRLRILPLLHGSVVVSRLVLLQPVIALEVDKAGRPNWEFGTPAAPAAAPPRATAVPARRDAGGGLSISGLGISGVTFEEVQLVDGTISYIDRRTGKAQQLDRINLAFPLPSLASPLAANGSAVWRGQRVTISLRIDQPSALFGGAESQASLKLAAALMTLDFSGRVAGPPSARLAGLVDLRTQSVRQFAQWMGSPITFSGGGFGPFAIKGTLATAGTKISINDADLSLDTINAKGSIAIDHAGARPVVTGKFAVDRLDLTPYLSPETTSTARPRGSGRLRSGAVVSGAKRWKRSGYRRLAARTRRYRCRPQYRQYRLPQIPDRDEHGRDPCQGRPAHRRSEPGGALSRQWPRDRDGRRQRRGAKRWHQYRPGPGADRPVGASADR